MDVFHERFSTGNIQSHGGFIKKEQLRVVEERPGDFDPSPMTAIEISNDFLITVPHFQSFQFLINSSLTRSAVEAVQGGVIEEVLPDGEIQIQCGLLEHDPQGGQRLKWRATEVVACNLDGSGSRVIESGDQREER